MVKYEVDYKIAESYGSPKMERKRATLEINGNPKYEAKQTVRRFEGVTPNHEVDIINIKEKIY